jgi:hypothetical protein
MPNRRQAGKVASSAVCVALLFISNVRSDGQADTQPAAPYLGLRTPEAIQAVKQFAMADQQAKKTYQRASDQARAVLIGKLEQLKEKVTKGGNLDEAVRIRDALSALRQGSTPDSTAVKSLNSQQLAQALANTKWKKVAGGFVITFHEDMSVTSSHHNAIGTWAAVTGDVVRISVSMNDCHSDVLKLTPDRHTFLNSSGSADFVYEAK